MWILRFLIRCRRSHWYRSCVRGNASSNSGTLGQDHTSGSWFITQVTRALGEMYSVRRSTTRDLLSLCLVCQRGRGALLPPATIDHIASFLDGGWGTRRLNRECSAPQNWNDQSVLRKTCFQCTP